MNAKNQKFSRESEVKQNRVKNAAACAERVSKELKRICSSGSVNEKRILKEIEARTGYSTSSLLRFRDSDDCPKMDFVFEFAKYLGIDPCYFFTGVKENEKMLISNEIQTFIAKVPPEKWPFLQKICTLALKVEDGRMPLLFGVLEAFGAEDHSKNS